MCRKQVLDMLPNTDAPSNSDTDSSCTNSASTHVESIDDFFKELLKSMRQFDTPQSKKRRSRVKVTPGKSVKVKDFK